MSYTTTVSVSFDKTHGGWDESPGYNEIFLQNQKAWLNQVLLRNGHLFLNEVYDLLGMERTRQGATAGWVSGDIVEFDNLQVDAEGAVTFDMEVYPNILEHLKEK